MPPKLTISNHSRDIAGLKYVYPVLSRRAEGLSVGINFNTNNACNWRCIYCQVPGLVKGSAPVVDLSLLAEELVSFLQTVLQGDFYQRYQVPVEQRVIKDIALSGNGEPSTVVNFAEAINVIGEVVNQAQIPELINTVLITNGSLVHQQKVQLGLENLDKQGGQVWFKLDSATQQGRMRINNAAMSTERVIENLVRSASLCSTWLQTCVFLSDGQGLSQTEIDAYLALLLKVRVLVDIKGVLLYSLARPSCQPESESIVASSEIQIDAFAQAIKHLGFEVRMSV